MNPTISLHRSARIEFLDALSYYLDADVVTARRFAELFDQALAEMRLDPSASVIVIDNIRRKLLQTFPYSIFYYHQDEIIRVIAVAHHRRSPYSWLGRK